MWRAGSSRVSRTGSTRLRRDRRSSQPVVVSDRVMFTALNATKHAERTEFLLEPRTSVPKRQRNKFDPTFVPAKGCAWARARQAAGQRPRPRPGECPRGPLVLLEVGAPTRSSGCLRIRSGTIGGSPPSLPPSSPPQGWRGGPDSGLDVRQPGQRIEEDQRRPRPARLG
jgi:hypothetical protein